MFCCGMTPGTSGIGGGLAVLVRTMAPQAGQFAATFQEARALAEVNRLMTEIPRIIEIGFDAARRRHAMALPAEVV